jgi:flavin reductase (DIM6/NTAB) family NADH-FMN oxidoreductase RutF
MKKLKALDADLEKALGRISSGLYIITAKKGELTSAMLASWVNQASFQPLGFTVAVAKDRAIESLMQVGDPFVLNILEEGKHLPLMKHFLKRFAPGADRFAGVRTRPATNGSPLSSRRPGLSGVRSHHPDGSQRPLDRLLHRAGWQSL